MAVTDADWDAMLDACDDEFGKTVTLRRYTGGGGSASVSRVTGVVTATYTDLSVVVRKLPVQAGNVATGAGISGGGSGADGVRATFMLSVALLTSGNDPQQGDVLIDDDRDWRVEKSYRQVNDREIVLECKNTRTG